MTSIAVLCVYTFFPRCIYEDGLSLAEPEHKIHLGEEQYHIDGTLPQKMHMQDRAGDAVLPHLKREYGVEDLEYNTETSDLLERIAWYQTEYDELREFTRNEKEVYEEFFNAQLSEANQKIRVLEDKNEHLEAELNESKDKCKDAMSTLILLDKLMTRNGVSKENEHLEKELKLLRMKLLESEMRRNDCEVKLELTESNFRNQWKELKQCLEEARTALSNAKEVNVCHQCNGHTNDVTRCEGRNEDEFPADVTELQQEIDTLKQLYEDLNKKSEELREAQVKQSLLLDVWKMENKNLKLSGTSEGSFEVAEKPQSACTALDMKIALQENHRLNCLQRKVARQRRILNTTRERELEMKRNIELYKNRIVQMELKAHNEDHMHKSHIYCLESLVVSLKNKNLLLRAHLCRVQRQMKTVVSPPKVTEKCGQLNHKDMAIQTSISSSDFCQMMGSDGDVIQDYGLPTVHVKSHNMENHKLSSLYPSKHLGKPNVIHHNKCTNLKQEDQGTSKQKYVLCNSVEKRLPMDVRVITSLRKHVQHQDTSQRPLSSCIL